MVILAVCVVAYVVSTMRTAGDIPYSELRQYFLEEKVQEFSISDTRITAKLKGGSTVASDLYDFDLFYQDLNELVQKQYDSGIITAYNYHADHSTNWLQLLLPYVLAFLGFILLMNLMNRMAGGGAGAQDKLSRFGEAKVSTPGEKKVTFQDVAGADEEKEELREIVEFLREPQKYLDLGAHIPKGVLLVGPPGTGKTLLAKAVAGEAGVQFLSISGSDFVEMYVGVGASRVRDLFQQAKKSAPAIIFIDEIDAVGRQRGAGLGGGHDEREQTLNQLLVEMDGFTANQGVIVLAATNRPDILDHALLRPGRFDRQVTVNYPDVKGREEILKVHSKGKPLGEDVSLAVLARRTPYMTGADLENVMNEAAILAARRNAKVITMRELEEAITRVQVGPEKKSRVITEKDKELVAFHEAGHAVLAYVLPGCDAVHEVSIIPRGGAGLIRSVVENSHVPVIQTGVGNCHVFVDASADIDMAVNIIFNAKTSRPSVCNAMEKLLVHRDIAEKALPAIKARLDEKKVELRGCKRTCEILGDAVLPAQEEDWSCEYLDYILAVKVVDSFEDALVHIARYSSGHSDAIITKGIIALLIRVLGGRTPQEILDTDLYFIDAIGLSRNLSPRARTACCRWSKQMRLYALAFASKKTKNNRQP